ncbi:MAG: exodeoxyribonuclease VII large subunit [Hyphomicrobiaceae bacterium]|nr:exodeoxyribonuclease VII large subunit [Hyphomicrobiaceae bacterium]
MTVTELSLSIKRTIEDGFGYVRLRGEISGYRGPHSSGHCYFALKDDRSKIDAVIWRGAFAKLRFRPEEGMEVIAHGRVTTYPNSSKYQIVVEALEPAGVGALMALLEERKRKFAAEGLFDEGRKKPLPFLPRVIGIVTSPTGAVIRDMLHGFDERFPSRVIVWPVRVQGETSAAEVAAAIRGFNALSPGGPVPRPEVLIVARGGGSLEDLWGFNEEVVVRAAADSDIPLISAVGHETDWTLIDLVADARAPTPTKAAEWAVPKHSELLDRTDDLGRRSRTAMRRMIEEIRANFRAAARGLPRPSDLLALPRQRFDAVEQRLGRSLMSNTRAHGLRLARVAGRLRPGLVRATLREAADRLALLHRRSSDALGRVANVRRTRLERATARLSPQTLAYRLGRAREWLDAVAARGDRAFANRTTVARNRLDGLVKLLGTLGYQSILSRGFALVRDDKGQMVRSKTAVAPGMALSVEFADGTVKATADGEAAPPAGGSAPSGAKPTAVRPATPGRQGSLF